MIDPSVQLQWSRHAVLQAEQALFVIFLPLGRVA
jgi:hypothetical protein